MDYGKMSLDELFEEWRKGAEADTGSGPAQEAAVHRIDAANAELKLRDGAMERYREMLRDPNARVRYAAAGVVQWVDARAAYDVFQQIVDAGDVKAMPSQIALYMMRDDGRLPR